MDSDKTKQKNVSAKVADRLPTVIGDLTVQACLASYPLALVAINLFAGIGSTYIQVKAEEQTKELLESLNERISKMESKGDIDKNSLVTNSAYQEVAHARLLKISSLDSKISIEVSACIIAMSAIIDGKDKRDKYLLRAMSDILAEELHLMNLLDETQLEYQKRIGTFTDLERRDAGIYENAKAILLDKFIDEGRKLVEAHDFEHLIIRLRAAGLVAPESESVGRLQEFSPKLSSLGRHFLSVYKRVQL